MWSVWPESVEIYLGQTVALLSQNEQEVQPVRFLPTLPVEQVLSQLSQALASTNERRKLTNPKRRSLNVTLSAAHCPPTGFSTPRGVTRWDELRSFASATAGAGLAGSPEQRICEMDDRGLGVAATVPVRLMTELKRWAAQEVMQLASVRPLWALVSQCALARETHVKALVVQEPDAMSLIAIKDDKQAVAMTMQMTIQLANAPEREPTVAQAHIRRWMMSVGLRQDEFLALRFDEAAQAPLAQGPKTWAKHWRKS